MKSTRTLSGVLFCIRKTPTRSLGSFQCYRFRETKSRGFIPLLLAYYLCTAVCQAYSISTRGSSLSTPIGIYLSSPIICQESSSKIPLSTSISSIDAALLFRSVLRLSGSQKLIVMPFWVNFGAPSTCLEASLCHSVYLAEGNDLPERVFILEFFLLGIRPLRSSFVKVQTVPNILWSFFAKISCHSFD